MIEIKLSESEFNSLIESNLDRYYITSVWTGRPYRTGERPKDVDGTARILTLNCRKITID